MRLFIRAPLLLLVAFSATATAAQVRTVAGNGTMAHADGAAELAAFAYPASICRTSDDAFIVADPVNQVIRKIDDSGVATIAGVPGARGSRDGAAAAALFDYPQGVACFGSTIFVADSGNGTIRKIENGFVSTIAGIAGTFGTRDGAVDVATFVLPFALAVDVDGTLIVADPPAHQVRRITTDGRVETIAGVSGTAGHRDGLAARALLNEPAGVAIAPSGTIFIAERGNHVIRMVDSNGVVSTYAGQAEVKGSRDGDRTAATFHQPVGLTFDRDGALVVADSWSHTLRRIDRAGAVTTIAGTAGWSGFRDGASSAAQFDYPVAVAAARDGKLLVADMLNHRVRSIDVDESATVRRRGVRP